MTDSEGRFSRIWEDVTWANAGQDMGAKWDLKVGDITIDVKARKKIRRSDAEPSQTMTWVELNTAKGQKGWLYGKADLIAFELVHYWALCSRTELVELIDRKGIPVITAEPTLYHYYRRKDKLDLLVLVSIEDICSISKLIPHDAELKSKELPEILGRGLRPWDS